MNYLWCLGCECSFSSLLSIIFIFTMILTLFSVFIASIYIVKKILEKFNHKINKIAIYIISFVLGIILTRILCFVIGSISNIINDKIIEMAGFYNNYDYYDWLSECSLNTSVCKERNLGIVTYISSLLILSFIFYSILLLFSSNKHKKVILISGLILVTLIVVILFWIALGFTDVTYFNAC